MRFDAPFFSQQDALRAEQTQITAPLFARATFEGIRALCVFREFYLRPLLQGLLQPSAREQAVITLHLRVVGLLLSIRKLDSRAHFQSIAAAARALFELSLDMALLSKDQTAESVERLEGFTRVERFRAAEKLVAFYSAHPAPPDLSLITQRAVVADPAENAAVESLVVRFWGGRDRKGKLKWPKHWSSFPDARGRAQHAGPQWQERYVRHYAGLSWHMHAGVVGVAGLPADAFDIFAADAHRLAVDTVLDSYRVLGHELHLAQAMPEWANRLAFLDRVTALALVDQRLQAQGDPPRFLYLEEHEAPTA